MTQRRHKITDVLTGKNSKLFGSCDACNSIVRVYRTSEYTLKDGTTISNYRCANQIKSYAYKRNNLRKRNPRAEKQDAMQAIPSSLAGHITQWEETQGGHCALCAEYVRKGRGRGRDMYVVTDPEGDAIPGLYCWDCRNLLHQRITGSMEKAIGHILSKERLRLTPPTGAGR